MPGYKHPCRFCNQLVPADSNVCPSCGRLNPIGPDRCPKCRNPIDRKQIACSNCGLSLRVVCPACGQETFFSDQCDACGKKLTIVCPRCKTEQLPSEEKCIRCGKPLPKGLRK